jgi:hypothetical protein
MADDLSKKGSQDRSRVNIHEDYKVRYWSKKLDCIGRPAHGRHSKVGNSAQAVEKELKR